MQFKGTVFRYGRDIDTDVIIPARYLNTSDPAELAKHCLEDLDTTFTSRVKPGDIVVADENFGCGSSREHAPVAIKAAGVSCVLAPEALRMQDAVGVCQCAEAAAQAGRLLTAQNLQPVYLRLSQAERERLAKEKENTSPQ